MCEFIFCCLCSSHSVVLFLSFPLQWLFWLLLQQQQSTLFLFALCVCVCVCRLQPAGYSAIADAECWKTHSKREASCPKFSSLSLSLSGRRLGLTKAATVSVLLRSAVYSTVCGSSSLRPVARAFKTRPRSHRRPFGRVGRLAAQTSGSHSNLCSRCFVAQSCASSLVEWARRPPPNQIGIISERPANSLESR